MIRCPFLRMLDITYLRIPARRNNFPRKARAGTLQGELGKPCCGWSFEHFIQHVEIKLVRWGLSYIRGVQRCKPQQESHVARTLLVAAAKNRAVLCKVVDWQRARCLARG
ncbi:unnamed protein product, partial [Pylaiella littoralis]